MTQPAKLSHNAREITATHPSAIVGIDISKWQPEINARAIKADGVRFAIIKATEASNTDPLFLDHADALGEEVSVGAYHLPRMCGGTWAEVEVRDPLTQARYAGAVAATHDHFAAGHWLDLEPDKEEKGPRHFEALVKARGQVGAVTWLSAWLRTAEGLLGQSFGVYLSPGLAKVGGEPLRALLDGQRRTWWALYQVEPLWPRELSPGAKYGYKSWDVWQFRADAYPGIPGGRCRGVMGGLEDCDLNIVNPASSLAQDVNWG